MYNSSVSESASLPRAHLFSADDLVNINRWVLVSSVMRGTVHSVNNILQTIGGQAEMLGQRPDAADDVRRRSERIVTQTARAASYMRELSAVARASVDTDRSDPRQMVDRVFALREYDLMRAHIAFEIRADGDRLPPCRMGPHVLSAVLLNLMLNAEQAVTGAQGGRIVMTIGRSGNRIALSVEDNGPGVPADLREKVFEPFFTTGRPGATLGLGLAVSRRLAVDSGGSLTLADAGPPGARFDVEVPAAG